MSVPAHAPCPPNMHPRCREASTDTHKYPPPRSPSPPSIIHHPQILPHVIPTPALIESVAGAAHYSGVKVDSGPVHHRRRSSTANEAHTDLKDDHARVMQDLIELYCCRPTVEIFERSWRKDATFEVNETCTLVLIYVFDNVHRTPLALVRAMMNMLPRYALLPFKLMLFS